ncbi:MAG: glycoside hydrolase family 97 catalytic domain-containing protein, partial [Bacteroidetes bacterium]|nr:glycoside hydrolase family 97 catalytic domain-containing protein [Bacteroidota bacterium]
NTYEKHLDNALDFLNKYHIPAVKTGYVGTIFPKGEYHHGQWMVNHYRRVVTKAAEKKIMILAHEPIKPTGIRRTYPNMMAREGLRGSEFNSPGGGGLKPEHLTIIPFTRMLGGPIDYTPGIFKLNLDEYKEGGYSVPTTLAYQLAEYIVVYGPMQMASDLPEHYEGHPAFQFIKDVAVDWEKSIVLNGEIGEYITIARKDRHSDDWFLGSLTDENAREITIETSFLDQDLSYEAIIYADGEEADFEKNNSDYRIERKDISHNQQLNIRLARGGGQAIHFKAKQ